MNLRNVRVVFLKEIKDITRDRRTLMFMIILPLALVPLLMLVMGKLIAFGGRQITETPSRVAVFGAEHSPKTMGILAGLEDLASFATKAPPELFLGLEVPKSAGADPMASLSRAMGSQFDPKRVKILSIVPAPGDRDAARKAIEAKELDAALVIPPGFDADVADEKPTSITIDYDSSFDKSRHAEEKLSGALKAYSRGVVKTRLPKRGLAESILDPFSVELATVASKEQEGRAILAKILPYMLILMCLSGAVYPATDLGAGEKERGTLETLLVSPAERSDLVMGKFFVIFVTSLVAAVLNVVSLAVSIGSGIFAELGAQIPLSVDPTSGLVAVILMLPVAAIFAAVLLSISIFAKSFKEAQAYFVPFNFVIIIPAFFSLIPGVELDWTFALIPLVNVSLAIKEALSGTYKWGPLVLIFLSTAVLAGACIAFCAAWFKREEVLFRT